MKRGSTFTTLAAADKASSYIAFLQLACCDQGYQFASLSVSWQQGKRFSRMLSMLAGHL